MELNLFKHHYFVSVTNHVYNKKAFVFIHCRANDVKKTITDELHTGIGSIDIETVTKLD